MEVLCVNMANTLVYNLVFGLVFLVLLLIASLDDWKSWSVNGYIVLACWVAACAGALLHPDRTIISIGVVLVLAIVCYLPFEIPMFGDADLIPFAFYFAYFNPPAWVSTISVILWPVALLACLPVYGKVWAKAKGVTWHWGANVPMPMLPCFAMAWVLSLVTHLIYLILI